MKNLKAMSERGSWILDKKNDIYIIINIKFHKRYDYISKYECMCINGYFHITSILR